MTDETTSKRTTRNADWTREWLASCVTFAVIFTSGFYSGDYDDVDHDAFFFAVAASCYLLCCLVTLRHFKQPR